MGDEVNPAARPRRLLLALSAALLAGVVIGVVADRVYLEFAQFTPDPRLLGDWVGKWGEMRFRPDGTYDGTDYINESDGSVTKRNPYTSQYHWVDWGTIRVYETFFRDWRTYRLVFEGDQLTLLGDNGTVLRYTRDKD